MKVVIVIVIVLIVVFLVFQIYTTMSVNKTETQPYKVIRVEKDFEIRYYPAATMAMIASASTSYRDLGNTGFRTLAKYIFGGNSEKKQIAMTSPVHMDIGDTQSTMSFVLPSEYTPSTVPTPLDSGISIITSAPEYVAVMRFSGFANANSIQLHINHLRRALQDKGLSFYGDFRFLGYNPPYQLFGRRNEVIVALKSENFN